MKYKTLCITRDDLKFMSQYLSDESIATYTIPIHIHFTDNRVYIGWSDPASPEDSIDTPVDIQELKTCFTIDDPVNHPSHYASTKVECIEAMTEHLGKEAVKNFCLGNVFKYLWRHNDKNGDEDVKKALWYFDKFKEIVNE